MIKFWSKMLGLIYSRAKFWLKEVIDDNHINYLNCEIDTWTKHM
jgi:hypothetical protein